jgi:hypothetical protein
LTVPVLGFEAADDLARSAPDRVAILAERADIDLARELRGLGARHPDAEVATRDPEALGPPVLEDLRASAQHLIDHDVFRPRDVPHQPRQGVEILTRADAHLLIAQAGEGALGR